MVIPFLFVSCSLVFLLLVFFKCTYKNFENIYILVDLLLMLTRIVGIVLFVKIKWNPCNILFLECPFANIIWRSQKWPLDTSVFTDITISSWIRILLRPNALLGIPFNEVSEFQLTAVIVRCMEINILYNRTFLKMIMGRISLKVRCPATYQQNL